MRRRKAGTGRRNRRGLAWRANGDAMTPLKQLALAAVLSIAPLAAPAADPPLSSSSLSDLYQITVGAPYESVLASAIGDAPLPPAMSSAGELLQVTNIAPAGAGSVLATGTAVARASERDLLPVAEVPEPAG